MEKGDALPEYTLPALRYDFGALEPHVSGRIMELHHDKHHAAYVKKANAALEQLREARDHEDFTRLAALERALAFNLSGHVLHSIFWQNLAPKGGGRPGGELAAALTSDFGGFEPFQTQLNAAASSIMGSGWAALVFEPIARRLLITQIYDHQSNLNQSGIPLMVLDAWEHAYYLQYQTDKARFFEALWNVWNWSDIEDRFLAAGRVQLELAGAVSSRV
jgi:Fe-Mn family superoxide dismutase